MGEGGAGGCSAGQVNRTVLGSSVRTRWEGGRRPVPSFFRKKPKPWKYFSRWLSGERMSSVRSKWYDSYWEFTLGMGVGKESGGEPRARALCQAGRTLISLSAFLLSIPGIWVRNL
jgi:hypothetical protein